MRHKNQKPISAKKGLFKTERDWGDSTALKKIEARIRKNQVKVKKIKNEDK